MYVCRVRWQKRGGEELEDLRGKGGRGWTIGRLEDWKIGRLRKI